MFDVEEKKGRANRQADIKGEFISLFPFCIDPGKRLLAYAMDVENLTWSPSIACDYSILRPFQLSIQVPYEVSSEITLRSINRINPRNTPSRTHSTFYAEFRWIYWSSTGFRWNIHVEDQTFPSSHSLPSSFSLSLSLPLSASSEWYLDATKTFVSCSAG